MLLFVTGPCEAGEPLAREIYSEIAAAWPGLAAKRVHPRTGVALVPAVTRLDLFLAALSPAPAPNVSGVLIHIPAGSTWWAWAPALRRLLRELILVTFPPGPHLTATFDPSGPDAVTPSPESAHLRSVVEELRRGADPGQRPVDPRLWLVLAPPLPLELESIFLSTFVRAEPFARVARVPPGGERLPAWVAGEVDQLVAGRGLVTRGLVADLESGPVLTSADDAGNVKQRSFVFDLVSGLQDIYASKEVLEPGEVYNRLHSHTGSEELYLVLEGEAAIRVNERVVPIRAGRCFGKPRGFDCSTQIVNTGAVRLVFLDIGTMNVSEIDIGRYPEHGELIARFAGQNWFVPTDAIQPRSRLSEVYDRRYYRRLDRSGG